MVNLENLCSLCYAVKRRRESISRKVKQQNITTSVQSIFQSNKDQIFNHRCTSFDNYPKCNILVRVSIVALGTLLRLVAGSASGVQQGYQQEIFPGSSRVAVGLRDTADICRQTVGVMQVRQ